MRQHLKNLIHKLLTMPDKTQAIEQAIEQTQNQQAKSELLKIKNKYFKT